MSPALLGTLATAILAALVSIVTSVVSRSGAKNAAEAKKDASLVKTAFDGLNETIDTLRADLKLTRGEVGHLRIKCGILGRNDTKMRKVMRKTLSEEEYRDLLLEDVPNGY